MKNLIYISLIGTLLFVSCEDFLKEEQHTNASLAYLKTSGGMESAVNGVYQATRYYAGTYDNTDNTSNSGSNGDWFALQELGTDFTWEGSDGGDKDSFNKYLAALNSGNGVIRRFWTNCYRGITRANTALTLMEDAIEGMSDAIKEQRVAELRFLRAFFYFDLVQHFGGVPIVTKGNLGEIITEFPRASVADVYKQIISDLRAAYTVLPDVWQQTQRGRATKWAVGHLLSKVYLTRGSYDVSNRGGKTTDLDSAVYYAQAVINSGKFQLESNYANVFEQNNQKESKEMIWAVQYTKDPLFNGAGTSTTEGGNELHLYWVALYEDQPGMIRDIENGRPYRRLRINPNAFINLWDRQNDSRVYKTFKSALICNNAGTIPTWQTVYYVNPANNETDRNDVLYTPPADLMGKPKFRVGDTAVYYSPVYYGALSKKFNLSPSGASVLLDNAKYREMLTDIGKSPFLMIPIDRLNEVYFATMKKWMDNQRESMNYQGGSRNFHRMRLAETYLIAAEALGRQGKQDEALVYINTVRKRAAWADGEQKFQEVYKMFGGTNDTQSTASQMEVSWTDVTNPEFPSGTGFDAFVDWILEERSRELYGELMRWEDLVRTGTLVARCKLYNPEAAPAIKDYHVLRPIPNDHIDRLLPKPELKNYQNPGYY